MTKLKNTKAKGSLNEIFVKTLFEEAGYNVTKAGGSLGEFDLIAIANMPLRVKDLRTKRNGITWALDYTSSILPELVLIQVKSNRLPGKEEMTQLMMFNNYPLKFGKKIIAIVRDGKSGKYGYPKHVEITEL